MSKKFDFIGVIIVVLVLLVLLFLKIYQEQARPKPNSLQGQNPAHLSQQKTKSALSPTISINSSGTAQEVTKAFYNFYFSSKTNPLADGAYKTNTYLSPALKDIIASQYNNGNTPLFCQQNKSSEITVGKELKTHSGLQETISGTGKDLYKVSLVTEKGKWLIDGVICLY